MAKAPDVLDPAAAGPPGPEEAAAFLEDVEALAPVLRAVDDGVAVAMLVGFCWVQLLDMKGVITRERSAEAIENALQIVAATRPVRRDVGDVVRGFAAALRREREGGLDAA